MSGRWAFYVDSAACSGCKACQVACKDRNGLPAGVLWRRVAEVAGGGWRRAGAAWEQDVFAYHLSVACNHCERPICVEVCPSGAMAQREDGIVLVDGSKCLGCRYCEWACPYGAPQYDEGLGRMTKCTFCAQELEAGRPPACVAACPMRALDFGDREELEARHGPLRQAYPLPRPELTEPSLVITPHRGAARAGRGEAGLANGEEVKAP